MKKIIILVLLILLIPITLAGLFYRAKYVSPTDFQLTTIEKKVDNKIDKFDGLDILFITDLCYGDLFGKEELALLQKKINNVNFDAVVFAGDIIDKNFTPVSDDLDLLIDFFSSLDGQRGKFFIYGDYDLESDSRKNVTKKIMNDSNYELIDKPLKIFNKEGQFIYLYGCSYDNKDVETQSLEGYVVSISHNQSVNKQLSTFSDYILCGNSHSKQVNNPFSSSDYKLGESGIVYISHGVGLTESDFRFLSRPEIVLLSLK